MRKHLLRAAFALVVFAVLGFSLVAVGIRSAQQQDALFFAVLDTKRLFVPPRPTAAEQNSTVIAGHRAFILTSGEPSKGKPWVWYVPTLPDLPGAEEQAIFRKLGKAGIAVAGIDVGESYGSPQGSAVFDAFYREMTQARGYSPHPVFLARSRGGLMALAWAEKHPSEVAAIAGIYPVSNIASYPGVAKAAWAYGMTAGEFAKELPAYNPIDNLAPLAKTRVPLYILHGDSDETVPIALNSALLRYRYAALGGPIRLRVIKRQGHSLNPVFFDDEPLAQFIIVHAH